jgi:hypothetical protein
MFGINWLSKNDALYKLLDRFHRNACAYGFVDVGKKLADVNFLNETLRCEARHVGEDEQSYARRLQLQKAIKQDLPTPTPLEAFEAGYYFAARAAGRPVQFYRGSGIDECLLFIGTQEEVLARFRTVGATSVDLESTEEKSTSEE